MSAPKATEGQTTPKLFFCFFVLDFTPLRFENILEYLCLDQIKLYKLDSNLICLFLKQNLLNNSILSVEK